MDLKVAVVCSSNQNRSMEAHSILSKKGFSVKSYGTGSAVKLPGSSPNQPNIYPFDTTYEQMYQDLYQKDPHLRIKPRPEKFQGAKERFDVIFTVEERIYDTVLEDIASQGQVSYIPVHIINLEIQDNHEEATLGAFQILELCELMRTAHDLENEIEEILQEFEAKYSRTLLHAVAFY
eukprot:Em0008g821a